MTATAHYRAQQLGRLHAAGIAVHVIRGNHDTLSVIARGLVVLESTHECAAEAVRLDSPRERFSVELHGPQL
ncbi:hypothetical protein [Paracoccus sanguinis]|uniref:hypothetical protein n=1 Tax=Paracoccus sanguinis TaxID=1545044 RepID=UPI0011152CCC|nr:hypothetical protein [Paracoccus sanguinis]